VEFSLLHLGQIAECSSHRWNAEWGRKLYCCMGNHLYSCIWSGHYVGWIGQAA